MKLNPAPVQAMIKVVTRIIRLRLKLSATCPATRTKRSIGIICVRPTIPKASADWVR
jgi:hypothetical protein